MTSLCICEISMSVMAEQAMPPGCGEHGAQRHARVGREISRHGQVGSIGIGRHRIPGGAVTVRISRDFSVVQIA
jgi:hypothetical protein